MKPWLFLERTNGSVPEVGREISARPRPFSHLVAATRGHGLVSTVAQL